MIQRINYSAIGIYDDESKRNHRYSYVYGQVYPMIMPLDKLLPFQISLPTTARFMDSFKLVKVSDNSEIDIIAAVAAGGLSVRGAGDFNIVEYSGLTSLGTGLGIGQYYFTFEIGGVKYWSDIFVWTDDLDELIKVEFWHGGDIPFEGGMIQYRSPFKSRLYLPSKVGKPTYPFEETVQKRNGLDFPIQGITYKQFRFDLVAAEYLLDFLRLIPLHDFVEIEEGGRLHKVDKFLMNDPQWTDFGDVAEVLCEFRTNTVVVVNGRGLTDLEYGEVPSVVRACPTGIDGRFMTYEEADSAGAVYWANMSFGGVVVERGASVAYSNDTEASNFLSEESCYPVTIGNQYGLCLNGVRKLNPEVVYDSDADAANGGVGVDGIYYAGFAHERAIPHGTAVIRLI